jgi:hypothetical protein
MRTAWIRLPRQRVSPARFPIERLFRAITGLHSFLW